MFRGDGLSGRNFHHAQMRAGNGDDNPIAFLRSGNKIDIYRISASQIEKAIAESPTISRLRPLLMQGKKHVGYWFEQYILNAEGRAWRWNTASVEGPAKAILQSL